MANYYVRKTGSNANAGTSAGAAWLTVTKALSAGAGPAGGDTIWVGPGVYREKVTAALTSPTSELKILGDVDGSHTGDAPGEVVLTPFTTDDVTAPVAGPTVTIAGKNFLTFQYLTLVSGASAGGTGNLFSGFSGTIHDLKIDSCKFWQGSDNGPLIYLTGPNGGQAANLTFTNNRIFMFTGRFLQMTLGLSGSGTSPTNDYDANVLIANNKLFGVSPSVAFGFGQSGGTASTGKPGGVRFYNNTILGSMGTAGFKTEDANLSSNAAVASRMGGNLFLVSGAGTAVVATTSGQILSDGYNRGVCAAPTNVTAGTADLYTNWLPDCFSIGEEAVLGTAVREGFTPKPGSVLLGYGTPGGTPPATDLLGRPRPAGGGSTAYAVGCLERHDTAAKEVTVTDGGGGLKIVGPGDQDFAIAVDAVSTTITVKYRSDANAAPTAQVLANAEIGVSASAVQTGSTSQGTFTTLTIPAFTPTAKGRVILRLTSGATTGGGTAYFDTAGVA